MIDGYTELAKLFKDRDNGKDYSPIIGTIVSLPELKIRCGSRVLLTANEVRATFNLYEKKYENDEIVYENLSKEVVLLPYSEYQRFIAIGVLQ